MFTLPLSWYDWSTVEKEVKPQTNHPLWLYGDSDRIIMKLIITFKMIKIVNGSSELLASIWCTGICWYQGHFSVAGPGIQRGMKGCRSTPPHTQCPNYFIFIENSGEMVGEMDKMNQPLVKKKNNRVSLVMVFPIWCCFELYNCQVWYWYGSETKQIRLRHLFDLSQILNLHLSVMPCSLVSNTVKVLKFRTPEHLL